MSLDKAFNKKFFNNFLTAVQEAGIKDAEYVQGLFEMLDAGVDISPEFYEIAGDVMGEAINSEAFWQNLHKKSPRAFEQLFNELKKIVSELKALFTGVAPEHDMRRMFHEADALIAMAENVAREYAKHRQSKAVVRTHSEAKRQTFFVYDKDTDKPIWKAGTPGAAGREGALEVARRINEGEATVDDIVAEHGVIEPVRRRGETDKKIAKDEAATDAFAAGTIHLDPRGDKITVLEQKEKTVKVIKTEKEGSKPYWISKEHLTPVEETPVEETPVEETPVEETPVEETPVEETPVRDSGRRGSEVPKRLR